MSVSIRAFKSALLKKKKLQLKVTREQPNVREKKIHDMLAKSDNYNANYK